MQTRREQWASRVAAWESSGLSQAGRCREHGVALASFGYWRRRLSDATAALLAGLEQSEAISPGG